MAGDGLKLAAVGVLATVAGAAQGAEVNLALGRPYEYYPTPKYHYCTDPGDTEQLTDGQTNYRSGSIWMQKSCVGWGASINTPTVIRIDLGREATLHELRFNSTGGGASGVVNVGLRVFVSVDDEHYILAGEVPPPAEPNQGTTRGVQLIANLKQVLGRYVAVAAMAPPPRYFVFVDEIEVIGTAPADPRSSLPVLPAIVVPGAAGAEQLQKTLAGELRAALQLRNLTGPIREHMKSWLAPIRNAQRDHLSQLADKVAAAPDEFDAIRAELTEQHRQRAQQVYGADTVVWETFPDEVFTMLSMPPTPSPGRGATVHTVINALEAAALGAANLTDRALPLHVTVARHGSHAASSGVPTVTPRVGRFFLTTNARYVPDCLLLTDCPQSVPAGESKLIWLGVESTGAQAGEYRYDVTVRLGDHEHLVPLAVQVHNVTLSKRTPLATGNWSYLDAGNFPDAVAVRDTMLDHRLTLGFASSGACPFPAKDADGNVIEPMQLDFTAMDKFLTFHRDFDQVAWFWPFNSHIDRPHHDWFGPADWMSDTFKAIFREWLERVVAHIREQGRGYDRFMFQMFDETMDEKVNQLRRLVREIDPRVRMVMTIPQATEQATRDMVAAGMNIFNHLAQRVGYDNAPDGFAILSSGGRELYFYGVGDTRSGAGKERDPLGLFRYLHWSAYHHGATGVHFWNMLSNATDGWIDETVNEIFWPMVYTHRGIPDDVTTAERVIPSRRWEYVRMGIEDYMLLKMAESTPGRERLQAIVKDVMTHRYDRERFRRRRIELIELVEAAQR